MGETTSPFSNQIDHVLIENKHKTIMRNAKIYRGADVDTDYYLVLIHFREKNVYGMEKETKKLWKNTMWIN